MNKLIKPAKKALAEKYGYKNVSVKNGKGTAWGWVECYITVPEPVKTCGRLIHNPWEPCYSCNEKRNAITREAEQIMWKAWQGEGLKPYTYTSDDGYGTESSEVLVSVKYL